MRTPVHIGIRVINLTKIHLWVMFLEELQGHNDEGKMAKGRIRIFAQ